MVISANFTEEEIEHAKRVGAINAKDNPHAPEGFWFKDIYIISIFLDLSGQNPLSFEESVEYYGLENVVHFIKQAKLNPVV